MKEKRVDEYCKFLSTQTIYCEHKKKVDQPDEYCDLIYDLYSQCMIHNQRFKDLPKHHK